MSFLHNIKYTDQAVVKSAAIVLATVVFLKSLSSPHTPQKEESMNERKSILWVFKFYNTMIPAMAAIQLYLMWISPSDYPQLRVFTAQEQLAFGTVILGGLLRIWCFRTLGKFFTFEIAIRKDHRLIKTGPYRFLRHPSYTGLVTTLWACPALYSSNGGFLSLIGPSVLFNHVTYVAYFLWWCRNMVARVSQEEEGLHKAFGREWEDFAAGRWRVFPFIW